LIFRDNLEIPALEEVSGFAISMEALRMFDAIEEALGSAHI
jgi:hypothetical protein